MKLDNLDKIRVMLNRPELTDAFIEIYMKIAAGDICGFCNVTEVPEGAESALMEMTVYHINRQGIEGTTGYSAGNISYSYDSGIPANIKTKLRPYVKGRVIAI